MPKIYDNVDATGDLTADITLESDNFQLESSLDPTKTLKFNQDGQPTATDVTIYSFESGAIPYESELPNLQNVEEGYVFFWIPNIPNTFQLVANHNPTSWALVNAPTGVTIDSNTGLISWDGTGGVFTGTVTIQVTNIFGTSQTDVTMTITSGYAGSPVLALDTLQISGGSFNQDDPIETWADASGGGHNFTQPTLGDRPTVDIDAFAGGVNGLRFDGISQFMTTASLSNQIYTTSNGNSGEVFITFRFDGLSISQFNPLYWSNRTPTQFHIIITYRSDLGYIQFAGGSDVKTFNWTPSVGVTYILRCAWSAGNYFEVQFEGESTQQQVIASTPTVSGATSYQVIAGADETTDATAYFTERPLYSDVTYGALVAYSNLLDGTQRQANFDYIKSLWSPA